MNTTLKNGAQVLAASVLAYTCAHAALVAYAKHNVDVAIADLKVVMSAPMYVSAPVPAILYRAEVVRNGNVYVVDYHLTDEDCTARKAQQYDIECVVE